MKGFVELLDDKNIPDEYSIQVVGGQPISLNKIVDLAEATSEDAGNTSTIQSDNVDATSSQKGHKPND